MEVSFIILDDVYEENPFFGHIHDGDIRFLKLRAGYTIHVGR